MKIPNLEGTAFHEAGHAVMAWALKRPIVHATIVMGELEEGPHGFYVMMGHVKWLERTYNRKKSQDDPAFQEAQEKLTMIAIAGAMAEGMFLGKPVRPPRDEADEIRLLTSNHHGGYVWGHLCVYGDDVFLREECRKKHLAWLRARTSVFLHTLWPLVDALAFALLEKKMLTGKEIRKLLKETVDTERRMER